MTVMVIARNADRVAPEEFASSPRVRTMTPTGLPAYARNAVLSRALTAVSSASLPKTALPPAM